MRPAHGCNVAGDEIARAAITRNRTANAPLVSCVYRARPRQRGSVCSQAPGQDGQTNPGAQEENCADRLVNPCGIVGLAGEILAKRKETGAQQTDTPEDDDGGSDAPTSCPQTRAEPGTEDHHQGREDKKVELLDPAVRARLQGAHRLGDGIVLGTSEQALGDESNSEKNRSNHARDRPDR
jgi:hypothetical protein